MAKIERVKDDDVLDIDNLIEGYSKRVKDGDDSILDTNEESIKENQKEKMQKKSSSGRNSKYSGPLTIYLDEYEGSDYSIDILQFKDFIDDLGLNGVTFEMLFDNIEEYNKETGNDDITVSKTKNKLYQMNALNTISLTTIRDIARMLGYEMKFAFEPVITDDIFENTTDINDI